MTNMGDFERWKPIEGYENLYEVSDFGRVRSIERTVKRKDNTTLFVKSRILKPHIDKYGYSQLSLCKDCKHKSFRIHQLVANAFIPNPNNLHCVNHKTECKTFNHFSALEWCDVKYNSNFGTVKERIRKRLNSKKIEQYTLDGKYIKTWVSANDISKELGCNSANIGRCCKGEYKQSYGFIWKYAS